MNYLKTFLVSFFIVYGIMSFTTDIFIGQDTMREYGYSIGYYIKTGEWIDVNYSYYYYWIDGDIAYHTILDEIDYFNIK